MKLYFFVSAKDESEEYLESASQKLGIDYEFIYFRDLIFEKGKLVNSSNGKNIDINKDDKLIIRLPWVTGIEIVDYDIFIHYFASLYPQNIALDRETFIYHGAFFEDKLFQAFLFENADISYPYSLFDTNVDNLLGKIKEYPVVVKKRISTRSRGNFLLDDSNALRQFFAHEQAKEYFIQKKVNARLDLRVMVWNGTILGAISRKMFVREGGRLAVKGAESYTDISDKVRNDCMKAAHALGGNLVGVDVMIDGEGQHYIIEANISPQFKLFQEVTGIQVGELIMEEIMNEPSKAMDA